MQVFTRPPRATQGLRGYVGPAMQSSRTEPEARYSVRGLTYVVVVGAAVVLVVTPVGWMPPETTALPVTGMMTPR